MTNEAVVLSAYRIVIAEDCREVLCILEDRRAGAIARAWLNALSGLTLSAACICAGIQGWWPMAVSALPASLFGAYWGRIARALVREWRTPIFAEVSTPDTLTETRPAVVRTHVGEDG